MQLDGVRRTSLTNLVNLSRPNNQLYGLQSNFLSVTYPDYVTVGEKQSGSSGDVIQALHNGAGQIVLPVESEISEPPPAVVTGDKGVSDGRCFGEHVWARVTLWLVCCAQWVYFVCNASSRAEAKDRIVADFGSVYPFFGMCSADCNGTNSSIAVNGCVSATLTANATEVSQEIADSYDNYVDVIMSVALTEAASISVETPLSLGVRPCVCACVHWPRR